MPTPCNLRVPEYPGSSEKEGREDTSDVFEIEHHLHQPVEPTTGQASGVRVHSPFRIVKLIDKATPGFHKALCTGQNLTEVTVDFYRIDPDSREEVHLRRLVVQHEIVCHRERQRTTPWMPDHINRLLAVRERKSWCNRKWLDTLDRLVESRQRRVQLFRRRRP